MTANDHECCVVVYVATMMSKHELWIALISRYEAYLFILSLKSVDVINRKLLATKSAKTV